MEYTGKESYGGTVDDGGRREMDKVIGILEDLIANFTLHEDKRGLYVQSSAQAIDDLYKGDAGSDIKAGRVRTFQSYEEVIDYLKGDENGKED